VRRAVAPPRLSSSGRQRLRLVGVICVVPEPDRAMTEGLWVGRDRNAGSASRIFTRGAQPATPLIGAAPTCAWTSPRAK
jgi:hypothetical protein